MGAICGLAGVWRPGGASFDDEAWIEEALLRIAHRGPDARGVEAATDAMHGHVRLAILDLDPRSDQPFSYGGGLLSYNGEAWNYRQIRADLEREGLTFHTTADTEVVAAALSHWGVERTLAAIDGQFALAWTRDGQTILARDRFGKMPLYLLEEDDSLFGDRSASWASERKAWDGGMAANPVPAGAYVVLGEPSRTRFWYEIPNAGGSDGDPAVTRELLETSVRDRLQADVPVTCLISGGVDSSSILALAQRHYPGVVAYTAVLDEGPVPSRRPGDGSDLEAARFVCGKLGVELREIQIPPPSDETIREAIASIEITMKAQIEIALLCRPLARAIRADGFKVCLTGEGADELFGGYGTLARYSSADQPWRTARRNAVEKMARGNLVRINKVFMAEGVEARTPFMSRALVEHVLGLSLADCPQQKVALREAVTGLVPEPTRLRHKLAFQVGTGMREACEDYSAGRQRVVYNDVARQIFGGLPRG